MACRQCCASGHGSARVAATSLVQRMDALPVEATWQLEGQQNQPMWRWQGYCWPSAGTGRQRAGNRFRCPGLLLLLPAVLAAPAAAVAGIAAATSAAADAA